MTKSKIGRRGPTPEIATPQSEAAKDDAALRALNTVMSYWIVCGSPACKRTRKCAGKGKACFDRFWPFTPERIRFEIRGYIRAMNDGLSAQEAARKVEADKALMADQIAAIEAEQFAEEEKRRLAATR